MSVEKIADVTYKEVMRMWNLPEKAAQRRLIQVRGLLKKKRWHKLSVVQYCQVEDISTDEFHNRVQ